MRRRTCERTPLGCVFFSSAGCSSAQHIIQSGLPVCHLACKSCPPRWHNVSSGMLSLYSQFYFTCICFVKIYRQLVLGMFTHLFGSVFIKMDVKCQPIIGRNRHYWTVAIVVDFWLCYYGDWGLFERRPAKLCSWGVCDAAADHIEWSHRICRWTGVPAECSWLLWHIPPKPACCSRSVLKIYLLKFLTAVGILQSMLIFAIEVAISSDFIRRHRMPDVNYCDQWSWSLSVVCHVGGCAKTAERIDVLFGVEAHEDPRSIVLDGGPHPPRRGGWFDVVCATWLMGCWHYPNSLHLTIYFFLDITEKLVIYFSWPSVVLLFYTDRWQF